MTYARKIDNNHKEIVRVLRNAGCFVANTSRLGEGFPDILVLKAGVWLPIEIKSGPKDKLTEAEADWWAKTGLKPLIATSPDDALRILGLIK